MSNDKNSITLRREVDRVAVEKEIKMFMLSGQCLIPANVSQIILLSAGLNLAQPRRKIKTDSVMAR